MVWYFYFGPDWSICENPMVILKTSIIKVKSIKLKNNIFIKLILSKNDVIFVYFVT